MGGRKAWLIRNEWFRSARLAQYPLLGGPPETWLLLGGRGAGKTRTGAEWVNGLARSVPPFARHKHFRLALVGETLADVRDVMIEGISGIATISRRERPRFEASRRRLVWKDGQVAMMFSSEDPESLRGHQFEAAWCDEVAKWRYAEDCFDMLQFGLRLGERPLQLLTTTPRPTPLLKRLLADPSTVTTHMTTQDNGAHLAAGFLAAVERRYAGSVLGRQELGGELIEDRADALWSRGLLETAIVSTPGELKRIVVAVDPPASSRKTSDACGIVAAGLDGEGRAVVLADAIARGKRLLIVADYDCDGATACDVAWCGAAALGLAGRGAVPFLAGRLPAGRGEPGRRDGFGGGPHRRSGGAGQGGQGAAGQVAQGRADRRALPAGPRPPCRPLRRTGGRDVRIRPGRAVERPLARPRGRAGLGGDGTDAEPRGRAANP